MESKYGTNDPVYETGRIGCKLFCVGWVDEVLLQSTGSCVQCPVINRDGKECDTKCVCVCVCVYAFYIYNIYMFTVTYEPAFGRQGH